MNVELLHTSQVKAIIYRMFTCNSQAVFQDYPFYVIRSVEAAEQREDKFLVLRSESQVI